MATSRLKRTLSKSDIKALRGKGATFDAGMTVATVSNRVVKTLFGKSTAKLLNARGNRA